MYCFMALINTSLPANRHPSDQVSSKLTTGLLFRKLSYEAFPNCFNDSLVFHCKFRFVKSVQGQLLAIGDCSEHCFGLCKIIYI